MDPRLLPIHMIYAELLKRIGVKQITVFNIPFVDLVRVR